MGVDDFINEDIFRKIRLSILRQFGNSLQPFDLDDVIQDTLLQLLLQFKRENFDENKSNFETYLRMVSRCMTLNFFKYQNAQIRDKRKTRSLDDLIEYEDRLVRFFELFDQDGRLCNVGSGINSPKDHLDMVIDIARLLSKFGPDVCTLCEILAHGTKEEVCRKTGAKRWSIYKELKRIRDKFKSDSN